MKKMICLLLCAILLTGTVMADTTPTDVEPPSGGYTVAIQDVKVLNYSLPVEGKEPLAGNIYQAAICNTLEQYHAYLYQNGKPYCLMTEEWNYGLYNEDFFKEHSVVLYYTFDPQLDYEWSESLWCRIDGLLALNTTMTVLGSKPEVENRQLHIIETKNKLEDVTKLHVGVSEYYQQINQNGDTETMLREQFGSETEPMAYQITNLGGDGNNDGKVDAADALLVLQVAVTNLKMPLAPPFVKLCNLDDDPQINAADALIILKIAVGKLPPITL